MHRLKNPVLLFLTAFLIMLHAHSQQIYEKKGIAIEGYDVVSYFKEKGPQPGKKEFSSTYKGVVFLFSRLENKEAFISEPLKFLPQYGGFCAYAMALKGKKVKIDPATYEIRDGKLYLFYHSGKTNTLQLWDREGAENLIPKADYNWKNFMHS